MASSPWACKSLVRNGATADKPIEITDCNENGTASAALPEIDVSVLQGLCVVSIDPGKLHCAVVQYDAERDMLTKARLYNLLCTCEKKWRRKGLIEQTVDPSSPMHTIKNLRQKDIHVPSSHDFTAQLLQRIADEGDHGVFSNQSNQSNTNDSTILVAVERQNGRDSGNMVIEATLLSRYFGEAVLQDPGRVKDFWNRAAAAAQMPPVFRKGSHSINKTDVRRLGELILSKAERGVLQREAGANNSHQGLCPSTLKYRKGRTKGRGKTAEKRKSGVKDDDLNDAVAQAICVAQCYAKIVPEDPRGAALRRLKRGALRKRLEAESEALYQEGKQQQKQKQRAKKRKRVAQKRQRKLGVTKKKLRVH